MVREFDVARILSSWTPTLVCLLLMNCAGASAAVPAPMSVTSAASLLAANHAAVGDDGKPGTIDARYACSGQGLTGEIRNVSDRATGAYVDSYDMGPMRGASGYDGRIPWMQDLSGAYTAQEGGDRIAVATNEAYRNANRWWRADRGGAGVELKGQMPMESRSNSLAAQIFRAIPAAMTTRPANILGFKGQLPMMSGT